MRAMNGSLASFLTAGVMLFGSSAFGAIFNDSTGENFDGFQHMDISSVEVTDDGTNITFKVSVSAADITSPADWGKYVIGIDANPLTGDFGAPVANPWGRNIGMVGGTDAWIGSWVDGGGGFAPFTYSGSWTQNGSGPVAISGNMTTITTSLASLGLSPGQTFQFDVYSTGGNGGDSANDAAANPAQSTTGWSGPYVSALTLSYTTSVPEPATLSLAAAGGLAAVALGRRRK
jgi:hypothetical protein